MQDRLWLAHWLKNWTTEDLLHLAPTDEFFIWSIRKPNFQNLSRTVSEFNDDDHYRKIVLTPACIGLFVMFTARKLTWVINGKGESRDGAYFREVILIHHVIPFLLDFNNVLVVGDATFVHDKAPCMRANAIQHLLKENGIDFRGNDVGPGNSQDFNATENIGAIIKVDVEALMLEESGPGRYLTETLRQNVENVLKNFENDTDLFERLLFSYPGYFKTKWWAHRILII